MEYSHSATVLSCFNFAFFVGRHLYLDKSLIFRRTPTLLDIDRYILEPLSAVSNPYSNRTSASTEKRHFFTNGMTTVHIFAKENLFVNTACSTLTVDISKPVFAMAESQEICKKNALCNIMNYSIKIRQISLHKIETMS
jgi:hypothetical protein